MFDVVYTIDANGFRVSAPDSGSDASYCILFFGGSYTFGAGVNDDEAMPYVLGAKSGGRFRTYNLGYSGYGPHQMLAALEHGIVEDILTCQPKYAVYQAITDHALRVANKVPWDRYGPRYIVGTHSRAVYGGSFNDHRIVLSRKKVWAQLEKSFIVRRLLQLLRSMKITAEDINLLVAIVDRSRELFENRFPGTEFHVIFWDKQGDRHAEDIVVKLKEKQIMVHPVSDILPDYHSDPSKYVLSEHDSHPNPSAHAAVADYISSEIVEKSQTASSDPLESEATDQTG